MTTLNKENQVNEKRSFTVTVDFTIDLDELAEDAKNVPLEGEELEAHNRTVDENIQSFWIKTDMELVNIVMTDLHETLSELGMNMVPVGFRRS